MPDLPQIVPKRSPSKALIGGACILLVLLGVGFLFVTNFERSNSITNASVLNQDTVTIADQAEAVESELAYQESIVVISQADSQELKPTTEASASSLQSEPVQTEIRQPTATRGPITLPTQPPSPTPTPTATLLPPANVTIPPTPTEVIILEEPAIEIPEPVLLKPDPFGPGARQYSSNRDIEFVWQWPGELTDNLSFEIRVWLPGQSRLGVHNATLLRQDTTFKRLGDDTYSVSLILKGAGNVKQTSSDYIWSVGVVEIEPEYKWLGIEAEPREISIVVPASGP